MCKNVLGNFWVGEKALERRGRARRLAAECREPATEFQELDARLGHVGGPSSRGANVGEKFGRVFVPATSREGLDVSGVTPVNETCFV